MEADFLHAAHAEQRAKERFGEILTDSDRDNMRWQIQNGRAIFLCRKPGNRHVKIWLVWWPSANRIVSVYFHEGKIKTVLPAKAVADAIQQIIGTSSAGQSESSPNPLLEQRDNIGREGE